MFHWLFRLSVEDKIYVSLLLCVSVILIGRYRTIAFNLKPLLSLTCLHLGVEVLADYLNFGLHPAVGNAFLYHLLTPLDYTLQAIVFYRIFGDERLKRTIYWSVPFFWGTALFFTIFYEPLDHVNTLAFLTESLLVISWCFLFFRSLLVRPGGYFPEKDPTFWIVVAILFYFVGTFFTFGSLNYFLKNNIELGKKVYYAGYTFYYLLYGTIGVTCLLNFPMRTHE